MQIDTNQLEFIHPKLRSLVRWLKTEIGFEYIITSVYRMNGEGVHCVLPVRGMDLRCRSKEVGSVVESFINTHWQYDPKRPNLKCCILHGKGSNLHLHLQVHPNTEIKE